MNPWVTVRLPHGLWLERERYPELAIRAVDTEDEIFLLESIGMVPALRVNALLARCIRTPDRCPLDPANVIRQLVPGDREALLLWLRRLSCGDAFTGRFQCPESDCAESLEIELRTSDLLLPAYESAAPRYTHVVELQEVRYEAHFRLPTVGDQEEMISLARTDPGGAVRTLMQRCVELVREDGLPFERAPVLLAIENQIATVMADLDPQAIIEFDMVCPACGISCLAQFDTADFLLRELDQRVDHLFQEVHTLARAYHWSEAAILAMPQARRERYIELIAMSMRIASS